MTAPVSASCAAASGARTGPWTGWPPSRLPRRVGAAGEEESLPVETTRHAFAYVFAGSGRFCQCVGPTAVPPRAWKWADRPVRAGDRR